MTTYNSELEVKQALGIDSFRNLSKDTVMRFAALMPDMDREVALKIVEQFPAFKDFALDAIDGIEKTQEAALAGNQESQAAVHRGWEDVRAILRGQLHDDNLTWDQKKYVIDLIMETAREQAAKDSENKRFLADMTKMAGAAIIGVVALGIVFVGGRLAAEQRNERGSRS